MPSKQLTTILTYDLKIPRQFSQKHSIKKAICSCSYWHTDVASIRGCVQNSAHIFTDILGKPSVQFSENLHTEIFEEFYSNGASVSCYMHLNLIKLYLQSWNEENYIESQNTRLNLLAAWKYLGE